jgi:predicted glycoside hydrolase/deacetylase ChbG (UPF0249 family)
VNGSRLVVTADDLGLSPGVTRGVLEAHRGGVVRSASLLVTFPGAEEAAALARDEPELEVGLHLDLVGGRPISDPVAVRSLVDAEGRFHRLGEFTRRLLSGRVRASELATEIRAQVRRARGLGTPALAWDSHRHVHLMPPVARVVGALARQEGARWVRRARPAALPRSWKDAVLAMATAASARALRGLPGNDWYCDLTSARGRRDAAAFSAVAARPGVGELGAHPGYVDAQLRAADALLEGRQRDLALLTDPSLRAALAACRLTWRVD